MMPCWCRWWAAAAISSVRRNKYGGQVKAHALRIHITCARLQAGWAGQVAKTGVDQRHHQAIGTGRMVRNPAQDRDQAGVLARLNAGRHFGHRQAVTGDVAFEYLDGNRLHLITVKKLGHVDDP